MTTHKTVMWETRLSIFDADCSKIQTFARDFEDSTSTSRCFFCISEVEHLFPQVGCARRNSSKNTHSKHKKTSCGKKSGAQIPTLNLTEEVTEMLVNCLIWITLSQTEVLLNSKLSCFFSRIMMLRSKRSFKGRSPMMRHVSRTHRASLGWLVDRVNLDPRIQIKYVDTKNQLADVLTKGNFTLDEWNHLLRLFNNMSFSIFC